MLKQLQHENILTINSDWSEHPPKKYTYPSRTPLKELTKVVYFIETEFCDLKSLQSWFRIPVVITDLHSKIILYQIAKGLAYLHPPNNNIVHRDLKPENILLCSNILESCVVVKIGDFGISREMQTTMTKGLGTFSYQCPEVVSFYTHMKYRGLCVCLCVLCFLPIELKKQGQMYEESDCKCRTDDFYI